MINVPNLAYISRRSTKLCPMNEGAMLLKSNMAATHQLYIKAKKKMLLDFTDFKSFLRSENMDIKSRLILLTV